MGMPAARVGDMTSHGPPLAPGPGSSNVFIGGKPAWRALPAMMGMALDAAQKVASAIVKTAESATMASDPLTKAGFLAAESAAKAAATATLTALMNGMAGASMAATLGKGQPDKHMCSIPTAPSPAPHGMGMVIDGSNCVHTNGLPQSAQGDKVLEALGGPDPIAMGMPTVHIGKCGGGGGGLFGALAALVDRLIARFLRGVDRIMEFVRDAVAFVRNLVNAVIDGVMAEVRRITQRVVDQVVRALTALREAVERALAAPPVPRHHSQEQDNSCVAASTRNLIQSRTGRDVPESDIRQRLGEVEGNPNHDFNTDPIDPAHASQVLAENGVPNHTESGVSSADLGDRTANGPVLIGFTNPGHRVMLDGVRENPDGTRTYLVRDPDPQYNGERREMSQADFDSRYNPNAIVIIPD